MEHKIFQHIQSMPRWLRVVLGIVLIIFGVIAAILPIIPGAFLGVIGLLFVIGARKIKLVTKIRKGMQHLFQNFSLERLKHKIYDMKTHIKHIFRKDKGE